jgi:hypothetical protein
MPGPVKMAGGGWRNAGARRIDRNGDAKGRNGRDGDNPRGSRSAGMKIGP